MIARNSTEAVVKEIFQLADLEIDGDVMGDPQVHDSSFYPTVLRKGSLGLGNAYINGWWSSNNLLLTLSSLIGRDVKRRLVRKMPFWLLRHPGATPDSVALLAHHLSRLWEWVVRDHESIEHAYEVREHHYNAGYDLFRQMLDWRMVYSCGYWRSATSLMEAQRNKLDLICRKLRLEPGMTLLDIGCGWGALLKYAVEEYNLAGAVGITVSEDQAEYARKGCDGLPIEILVQDYRETITSDHIGSNGSFDRIASVGMFEHVGDKNHHAFMRRVRYLLKRDGAFLLHSIVRCEDIPRWRDVFRMNDAWLEQHIFRRGKTPSERRMYSVFDAHFHTLDHHLFRHEEYADTLAEWRTRLLYGWENIADSYSDRFKRMMVYYLTACEASFREHKLSVLQLLGSHEHKEWPAVR